MLFRIAANHPCLPGHFPGHPVVPGVVVLEQVIAAVQQALPEREVTGVRKMKFLRPLLPDQRCSIVLAAERSGRLRFECRQDDALLAEGNLLLSGGEA